MATSDPESARLATLLEAALWRIEDLEAANAALQWRNDTARALYDALREARLTLSVHPHTAAVLRTVEDAMDSYERQRTP